MSSTTILMSASPGASPAASSAETPAAGLAAGLGAALGLPSASAGLASCAVRAGDSADCLPPGTRLRDFVIDRVLGEGGFGVVYSAYDISLGRRVAIKEYMPSSLARRRSDYGVQVRSSAQQQLAFAVGLKSFVKEARLLARFDHPALIKVHQFWEENGTAYFVMPYYTAPTLKTWLANLAAHGAAPDDAWMRGFFRQALDALAFLHRNECLHRDVSPENILVLDDRSPLLLDFGAARRVVGDMTQALTVILKPGYAPLEQYTGSMGGSVRQGPWTDLYALCAVMYFVISGRPPFAAVDRVVSDRLLPAADVARGRYSESLLNAIDTGLQLHPGRRPQTAAELAQMLGDAPSATKVADVRVADVEADPDRTVLSLETVVSSAPLTAVTRSIDFGAARAERTVGKPGNAGTEATGATANAASTGGRRATDSAEQRGATVPAWLTLQLRGARGEPASQTARDRDSAHLRLAAVGCATLAVATAIAAIAAFVSGGSSSPATSTVRTTTSAPHGEVVVAPLPITVAAPIEPAVRVVPALVPAAPKAAAIAPSATPTESAGRRPAVRSETRSGARATGVTSPAAPTAAQAAAPAPAATAALSTAAPGAVPGATFTTAATRSLPVVPAAMPANAVATPAYPVVDAAAFGATTAATEPAVADSSPAAAPAERAPVQAALRAISKPQPQFPVEALRDGVRHGRVTVTYTVEPDGSIAHVRVASAEPQNVFNRAARNAVARWRFEPIAQATPGSVEFVFDATK